LFSSQYDRLFQVQCAFVAADRGRDAVAQGRARGGPEEAAVLPPCVAKLVEHLLARLLGGVSERAVAAEVTRLVIGVAIDGAAIAPQASLMGYRQRKFGSCCRV